MEYRLGDIIDCIKGYAFKSKEFRVSGIPIVKVSNLNEGLIDNNKWVYLDINMYDRFKKYKLKEDDAVISTVGSWKNNPNSVVGKCCIIQYFGRKLLNLWMTTVFLIIDITVIH